MTNFDKISDNAADFSKSLMSLADYVDGSFEKIIRKACIDLYRAIVEKWPVDTGRSKASWSISTHFTDDKAIEKEYSFNEIESIINQNVSDFKLSLRDDQVIIYNNMEYAEELEAGSSRQAPSGAVSISLVEFTAFFNNALDGLEGIEPI